MNKKKFALIGHPIGHSMSAFIHKRLFEISKIDACYNTVDILPQKFENSINFLKELDGFNITIPYKETIIPYLDHLDEKAKMYGSVNTVKNDNNLVGYTTDANGFLSAIKYSNIKLTGTVVILGCGGLGRVIAYESALKNCNTIICVRKESMYKARKLSEKIKNNIKAAKIKICTIEDLENDDIKIDLLVNATPVGMYPEDDNILIKEKVLFRCINVFDAIYNPLETKLVKLSKANGINAVGGMSMLIWQAVEAHSVWNGSSYNNSEIDELYCDTIKEMKKVFGRK